MRKQVRITIPKSELAALLADACQAPIDDKSTIYFDESNSEMTIVCEVEERF